MKKHIDAKNGNGIFYKEKLKRVRQLRVFFSFGIFSLGSSFTNTGIYCRGNNGFKQYDNHVMRQSAFPFLDFKISI